MRDYTEVANKYAKDTGRTEPDWLRKQVVQDFTAGANFADKANEITDSLNQIQIIWNR